MKHRGEDSVPFLEERNASITILMLNLDLVYTILF